jgi:ribosomal protein S12 methylthiotransferase
VLSRGAWLFFVVMNRKGSISSVAFVSLGCPKNLVDSERMLGLLAADGIAVTPDEGSADAIVINTCGFLEASKEESMREIHRALEFKRKGRCKRVIVAGCLVQRHKTKLLSEAPEIDRLVGVFDREHIVEAVRGKANPRQEHGHYLGKYHDLSKNLRSLGGEEALSSGASGPGAAVSLPVFENDRARLRLTPRHYAYLRMSEGCNQGCSFCTIPSIRGPMRSKPPDQVLAEARELAADGAVEINLIGQDTTSYGSDLQDPQGLSGLLRMLDRSLKDVRWIRLMYAYPSCFTDEMIDAIAQCDRVVKYIDMPLQHINDRILKLMKRRVTRRDIETLLSKLRKRVPGISIRTTFIAGSPTETPQEHAELVQFVRDFEFEMMGVFPYSPEPGTAMGRMSGQTDDSTKQARLDELMLAQQEVAFRKARRMVGEEMEVLLDSRGRGEPFVARHAGQAPDIDSVVHVKPERSLHVGQFVRVQVTDYQNYDLVACVTSPKSRPLAVI